MYYRTTRNDRIILVGISSAPMQEEITEEEYNETMTAVRNKPEETEKIGYWLKTDLTWEQYGKDPPDPDPEVDDGELLNILMGVSE